MMQIALFLYQNKTCLRQLTYLLLSSKNALRFINRGIHSEPMLFPLHALCLLVSP